MEITCTRCHQPVLAENCYCPYCGLPQFVYEAEGGAGQGGQPDRVSETMQDASSVAWKPALRAALMFAVPAGLLSSGVSPLGSLGMVWAAVAAAWAVTLYMRNQRAAWITTGAGARIGLVTGLLAAWLAFSVSGSALFVERFVLHQAVQIDAVYQTFSDAWQQKAQETVAAKGPTEAAQVQPGLSQIQAWIASPEGHAGIWTIAYGLSSAFLLLFAIGGGALCARWLARTRRSEL
jgi:hypothetical protein